MSLTSRQHYAISAGCVVAGFGAGYLIAVKRVEKKYRLIAEEEINEARRQRRMLSKQGEFSTPQQAFPEYAELTSVYKSGDPVEYSDVERRAILDANILNERTLAKEGPDDDPDTPEEVIAEPAWTEAVVIDDDSKQDEEVKTVNVFDRKPPTSEEIGEPLNADVPYVITQEEYAEDHEDYAKDTITYYDGDDILADDQNEIIPDIEFVIGDLLTAFNGTTVIYVRNEKMETDFEVCMSADRWSDTVMGITPDEPSAG